MPKGRKQNKKEYAERQRDSYQHRQTITRQQENREEEWGRKRDSGIEERESLSV